MNRTALDDVRRMMTQYLAGALGPDQVSILNAKLKHDPALLREAALVLLQEQQLREMAKAWRAEAPALEVVCPPTRGLLPRLVTTLSALRRTRRGWAGGLALAAIAIGLFLLSPLHSNAPRLTSIRGTVTLERAGALRAATPGAALHPGDRLRAGDQASVTIGFARESTVLRLGARSVLQTGSVRQGKQLQLESGSLAAVVAPQPKGRPLRIATSNAVATVLGTQFTLAAKPQATTLEVWQGKVAFAAVGSRDAVQVGPREFAVAQPGVPLAPQPLRLGLRREFWLGIPGSEILQLTNDPRFPQSPAGREIIAAFEDAPPLGDAHGSRIRGYLHPWVSGDYQFWIAGDDACELWLSRDEDPGQKVRICGTREWTRPQAFDKQPEQKSGRIHLDAGGSYYLEVLHKQHAGAESIAVAWQPPNAIRTLIPHDALTPDPAAVESGGQQK